MTPWEIVKWAFSRKPLNLEQDTDPEPQIQPDPPQQKPKPKPITEWVSEIEIVSKDFRTTFAAVVDEPDKKLRPWLDFYRWYFGRQTEKYMFEFDEGERLILRSNIVTFNVKVKKRVKKDAAIVRSNH